MLFVRFHSKSISVATIGVLVSCILKKIKSLSIENLVTEEPLCVDPMVIFKGFSLLDNLLII